MIPESFIDDLLDRVDILDVVDSRVKLKKAGKDYTACCPFHKEKTPSFTVSQDKQFYYCFGCGATGTAISFLMNYEHLGFVDTIEQLARQVGLEVPREKQKNPESSMHQRLYKVLSQAQQHFETQLAQHPKRKPAVDYLRQRGLTDSMMQQFHVGYAPPGWDNMLKALGLDTSARHLLTEAGLLSTSEDQQKQYDRFRDRIIFPIIDVRGRTIGFGGRILTGQQNGPKYLNSPETPVFHKGKELYGLYQALQARRNIEQLIVVEGYMDVISLAQFGVTNAVATLGTACGEDHLNLAFKYTSEIIFCFDGDNAGRRAAKRALQNALSVMGDGKQIRFLFLPEGQDPDTLVRAIGAERFQEELAHATPLESFFFDATAEGLNTQTMEGKARLSKLAAPMLNQLAPGVFRELMFAQLAQRTGLSQDVIQELLHTAETPQKAIPAPQQPDPQPEPHDSAQAAKAEARNRHNEQQQTPAKRISALLAPEEPPVEPQPTQRAHQHGQTSRVRLSPAKLATCILLDQPSLLAEVADTNLPQSDDHAIATLCQLIEHLKTHPQSSFHSILGFWGGRYGLEAQKYLGDLVANRFLESVRKTAPFNDKQELEDALAKIRATDDKNRLKSELTYLSNLPDMTEDQKNRLKTLLTSQSVH